MVMLAILAGVLVAFAWFEVTGAEEMERCADGRERPAPPARGYEGEYAAEWHWRMEADPCVERWVMPTKMASDNRGWFSALIGHFLGYPVTIHLFIFDEPAELELVCGDATHAGCARAEDRDRGWMAVKETRDGEIYLPMIIHELTHIFQQMWMINEYHYVRGTGFPWDGFLGHGSGFYGGYAILLRDLLGVDLRPYCAKYGPVECDWSAS